MHVLPSGRMPTNTELPLANLIVEQRHDYFVQSDHVRKVAEARPEMDLRPGMVSGDYPHIRNNPKLRLMEDDRRAAIDNENMILLNKMRTRVTKERQAQRRVARPTSS